jgi:fumarate hydratase class II
MPGKVNPTQCEAIVMIAIQVLGDDSGVAFAGSQGNFELNAMRPIIINNFLHSATILADGCEKFRTFSVEGTELNEKRIAAALGDSQGFEDTVSNWMNGGGVLCRCLIHKDFLPPKVYLAVWCLSLILEAQT